MIAPIFLLVIIGLSVVLRVNLRGRQGSASFPEHAKDSPISKALQEMIATAGGIYLSLVLLFSFLQIDVISRWRFNGTELEPLAFTSIILSVLQPFIVKIYFFIKGS